LHVGHLKTLVYAAPADTEETLHYGTVDTYQTIRNYPSVFERMLRAHDETCRGVHWISWRTFSALIICVLFQLN
jgi:hypothetical protein